jgi:hypothetical protein
MRQRLRSERRRRLPARRRGQRHVRRAERSADEHHADESRRPDLGGASLIRSRLRRQPRLRDVLRDRRNTERAREVLQHGLTLTRAKLRIFTTPDGKRDFTISGTVSLSVPAKPLTMSPKTAKLWRPHGDSNPGYRRERAMS